MTPFDVFQRPPRSSSWILNLYLDVGSRRCSLMCARLFAVTFALCCVEILFQKHRVGSSKDSVPSFGSRGKWNKQEHEVWGEGRQTPEDWLFQLDGADVESVFNVTLSFFYHLHIIMFAKWCRITNHSENNLSFNVWPWNCGVIWGWLLMKLGRINKKHQMKQL